MLASEIMVKPVTLVSVSMTKTAKIVVSLPLSGLIFTVMWSILFDLENSTATHCKVANYLPSVSAAIALTPQAYVWRFNIALHSMPRYMLLLMYWEWHYKRTVDKSKLLAPLHKLLIILAVGANFIELSALLGLTIISSTESPSAHETSFILFMIGSITCMISSCLLNTTMVIETENEKKSKNTKLFAVVIHITSFISALYFYFRHNAKCEPGVYSLFALSEYIVIISNMFFHYQHGLDFCAYKIQVNNNNDLQKIS